MNALPSISPAELEDLKLCGITNAEQLRRASAATVWADVQKAQEFFPSHRFAVTEARLQQLCGGDETSQEKQQPDKEDDAWANLIIEPTRISTTGFKRRSRHHDAPQGTASTQPQANPALPNAPLPLAEMMGAEELAKDARPAQRVSGLSKNFHAIHCNRSFSTYLGAWAALMVVPSLAAMVLTPILLLGGADTKKIIFYGVLCILLGVPHMFLSRMATCSVCHIGIFSFRNYPRNKAAHHLPLLGYTLATALHVIIFFQFRCPACGTQMKLFGRHHGKPHHH